jgi:3-oxoacid CoA-transferase
MDKLVASPAAAVADIRDGASIGIAGFGVAHRFPSSLIGPRGGPPPVTQVR